MVAASEELGSRSALYDSAVRVLKKIFIEGISIVISVTSLLVSLSIALQANMTASNAQDDAKEASIRVEFQDQKIESLDDEFGLVGLRYGQLLIYLESQGIDIPEEYK